MSVRMVGFDAYRSHYGFRLAAMGVAPADAEAAILLGWDITYVDQACYGVGSTTPVSYNVLPPDRHPIMAGCSGRRFDGRAEGYIVYPTGLAMLQAQQERNYDGLVPSEVLRMAIAVHEVRHRVQDREAASLRMFDRTHIRGMWASELAAVVTANMDLQFREEEEHFRADGVDEAEIAWKCGPVEFDAEVVERMYIHLAARLRDPQQLAAHVRMNTLRVGD